MHIPDGYLTDPVCALTAAAACGAVVASAAAARRAVGAPDRTIVVATTVGIAAVQAANFPVGHGTSGHLLGAVAAAAVLGPWRALLAISGVLTVQAALLGDGGLATLGANALNMAVLPCLIVALAGRWAARRALGTRGQMALATASGAASVLVAASACAVELALAGPADLPTTWSAMLVAHLPVALAEGLATAGVVGLLARRGGRQSVGRRTSAVAAGSQWIARAAALSLAIGVVGAAMFVASPLPDGLEAVAAALAIEPGTTHYWPAVLAGAMAAMSATGCGYALARVRRQP